MRSRRRALRSLTFASFVSVAAAASAQYVSGYSVGSITHFSPNSHAEDSKDFNNTTPATYNALTQRSISATLGANEIVQGYVAGQMGTLKAKAYTKFPGASNASDYATTHSNLNTLDYLTVTSGNLPSGTVVSLNFKLHLSGTFSTPSFQIGGQYQASAAAGISMNGQVGSFTRSYQNTNNLAPSDLVASVNAKVGEKISFSAYLDALTYVGSTATVGKEALVDFSSTANLYAWSNNANVTLVSQSGHNYAPVPEPATFAALVLGALTVARRRR